MIKTEVVRNFVPTAAKKVVFPCLMMDPDEEGVVYLISACGECAIIVSSQSEHVKVGRVDHSGEDFWLSKPEWLVDPRTQISLSNSD